MIGIIDYGSGNVQAIATIYKNLNINYEVITKPEDLEKADKLILPGVGAFDATMQQLIDSGLKDKLNELVLDKRVPILGICVGLQVMGNGSEEGDLPGLGWIPGKVRKFDETKINFKPKLPHMGWNTINDIHNHKLFQGINNDFGFYFVHSFYFQCESKANILTTSKYSIDFASAIFSAHIIGTQFHPEKSHGNGVKLFKNFSELQLC
jgi:imidazole glycerol-phosphate synthase subunit HisH